MITDLFAFRDCFLHVGCSISNTQFVKLFPLKSRRLRNYVVQSLSKQNPCMSPDKVLATQRQLFEFKVFGNIMQCKGDKGITISCSLSICCESCHFAMRDVSFKLLFYITSYIPINHWKLVFG